MVVGVSGRLAARLKAGSRSVICCTPLGECPSHPVGLVGFALGAWRWRPAFEMFVASCFKPRRCARVDVARFLPNWPVQKRFCTETPMAVAKFTCANRSSVNSWLGSCSMCSQEKGEPATQAATLRQSVRAGLGRSDGQRTRFEVQVRAFYGRLGTSDVTYTERASVAEFTVQPDQTGRGGGHGGLCHRLRRGRQG